MTEISEIEGIITALEEATEELSYEVYSTPGELQSIKDLLSSAASKVDQAVEHLNEAIEEMR